MLCAGIQCFQIYRLWFDVGVKRYTTVGLGGLAAIRLWFDVGVKRYTTLSIRLIAAPCCGLM